MLALALIVVQWASPRPSPAAQSPGPAGGAHRGWRAAQPVACELAGPRRRPALIGALRYRRILVVGALVGLALLVTPAGQEFVVRFVSGFSTADRATAFRVGEYANALTLLQRYPLLGIGFGSSPDIDVTAGVSSVYLLVAEQTGFLGLGAYLAALWTRGGLVRTRSRGHWSLANHQSSGRSCRGCRQRFWPP